MSNRRFSPDAFRIALRADRSVANPLSLDWSKDEDKHGLMIWHARQDGQLLGYVNLDGAKHHANVFLNGTIEVVRVGSFPMSRTGLILAQREVEAAIVAATQLVEAA